MKYKGIVLNHPAIGHFVQVSKRKAERLYLEGKKIYLHPSNMKFVNGWQDPMGVDRYNSTSALHWLGGVECSADFDNMVDTFECFNCNREVGMYAHFFIKVK